MFSRVHGATPGRGHVTVLGRQPADLPVRTHLAAPGPASRRGRQRRRCYPAHGSRGLRREEGRRDGRQRQQDGHGRFERLGRRAEESVRRGLQGLRDAKRQDRHRQHRRPQHVPREHQPVPTGFAGRHLHLVRRVPHAVLRQEGPAVGDHRPVVGLHRVLRRVQGGVGWRGRQDVLRALLPVPLGGLLPAEPVEGEGLHRAEDVGRVQGPGDQDEGRRPGPDRLRRQGRLAGDGHVRLRQHADERLRLPHQPDAWQRVVDRPEGEEDLRHLGLDPSASATSSPRASGPTSTTSCSRRSTRHTARPRSRRRSTASS